MTARKVHSGVSGSVLDGVDWSRFTVVLLKPDCVRRGLVSTVIPRIAEVVDVVAVDWVTVADWQIFVHYWDLVVDRDWFAIDVVASLRNLYVGHRVVVALGRGEDNTTTTRVRSLLGHFDPSRAAPGTIRGNHGTDSHRRARAEYRLVENLIHSSDDPQATCRDFGIWFGANRYQLLDPTRAPIAQPHSTDNTE